MSEMLYLLAEYLYYKAFEEWVKGYNKWYELWWETEASFNPGQDVLAFEYAMPTGEMVIEEWAGGEAEWFMYADPSDLAMAQIMSHDAADQALSYTIEDGAELWWDYIDRAANYYDKAMAAEFAADLLQFA